MNLEKKSTLINVKNLPESPVSVCGGEAVVEVPANSSSVEGESICMRIVVVSATTGVVGGVAVVVVVVVVDVVVVVVGEGMHAWSFVTTMPGRSRLMRWTSAHVTHLHWRNDTDCSLG